MAVNWPLWRLLGALMLTVPHLVFLTLHVRAQEAGKTPDATAVSQTGLLPVYGVDLTFDPAWIDGTPFPSQSTEHPNSGVNATLQKVWDALKGSGFNIVRFPVNVGDMPAAANRVANLSVWAKNSGVSLVPVLIGNERGQPLNAEFQAKVSVFIKALIAALRGGDGQYLGAYSRILAYQLESEMNHAGLHGAMSPQSAQEQMLQAAATLRKDEQEALEGTDLNATPLMVNASFDYELIKAKAIAGVTLGDDAYTKAYDSLKQFLLPLAASADLDLIGVDWYAGSVSAGSVERFPVLLRSLTSDLAGKQIVFTTGFSTGFRPAEGQKQFYTLTFTNLADYRASEGVDCPFVGVFFHEALNGAEPNAAPPTADLPAAIAQWDWPAKAAELEQMWNEQTKSEPLAWWLKKVENNMGLVKLQSDSAGTATVSAQPAQESLQQIASTVSEANTAAASEGTPPVSETTPVPQPEATGDQTTSAGSGLGTALKEKGQQYLLGLLDRVFERLDSTLGGFLSGAGSGSGTVGGAATPTDTGVAPSSGSAAAAITITKEEVSVQPTSAVVGSPISFSVALHNQSSDADATGLVVAVVDAAGALAYASDIAIARGATQNVTLEWTPASEGQYELSVQVYDASLTSQMSSVALDPLSVAASAVQSTSEAPADVDSGAGSTGSAGGSGSIKIRRPVFKVPLGLPKITGLNLHALGPAVLAGQSSSVSVSMSNSFSRPIASLVASLVVDGKVMQKRKVGTILPKQTRSVVFQNVAFARAGKQEVKVLLETGGAKPLSGSITGQVQVAPKLSAGVRPILRGSRTPAGQVKPGATVALSPAAKPPVAVRGVLPTTFKAGRLSIPTAASTQISKTAGSKTPSSGKPAMDLSRRTAVGASGARSESRVESGTAVKGTATKRITLTPSSKDREPDREKRTLTLTPSSKDKEPDREKRMSIGVLSTSRDISRAELRPDLSVTATYTPNPARPNQTLTIHIQVKNLSNAFAKDAHVTCELYANNKRVQWTEFKGVDIGVGGHWVPPKPWSIPTPQQGPLRLQVRATVANDANTRNNQVNINVNIAPTSRVITRVPR